MKPYLILFLSLVTSNIGLAHCERLTSGQASQVDALLDLARDFNIPVSTESNYKSVKYREGNSSDIRATAYRHYNGDGVATRNNLTEFYWVIRLSKNSDEVMNLKDWYLGGRSTFAQIIDCEGSGMEQFWASKSESKGRHVSGKPVK